MYSHGLSTRRIEDIIHITFGVSLSKSKVSELCKELNINVNEFFEKDIFKYDFQEIQIDGKYFRVYELNEHRKSALISAIGITKEGIRVLIHFKAYDNERYINIKDFANKIKSIINQDVECFVVDVSDDMSRAIYDIFVGCNIQRCLVHTVRTIKSKLNDSACVKDKKAIERELNSIFFYTENKDVKEQLNKFMNR